MPFAFAANSPKVQPILSDNPIGSKNFPMKLNRLGLNWKIGIGFGSLLLIIAVVGTVGYHSAVVSQSIAREVQSNSSKKDLTLSLQMALELQRIGARDVLLGRDEGTLGKGRLAFQKNMDELKPLLSSEASRRLYAAIERSYPGYRDRYDRVLAMHRSGDRKQAMELWTAHDALVTITDLTRSADDLAALYEQQKQEAVTRQAAVDARTRTLTLVLVLAGLLLGVAIASVIARSILGVIHQMLRMIQTIASNNLAVSDMEVAAADEIGNAARGLNEMKNSLREVILSIASTAEVVSDSSRAISTTALQTAHSAESQKHQVEQIATAMQEMAATVHAISRHSIAAAQSATSAVDNARNGGTIVEDVLERMRGIADAAHKSSRNIEQLGARSDEIGRIVGVIDDIAAQTDLLALNAAIEAARAGEQGRGFAVVASEVRRLAERTSIATGEIAKVIRSVQTAASEAVEQMRSGTTAVEQGVEATGRAGTAIRLIIDEADDVGAMVAQIAAAATQQSATTEQINATMFQISELVAESAKGSQHSARACEQLFTLALGLQTMVARFQLA